MTAQGLWAAAAAALALAVLAGVADRRRERRRNLDESGWVPWRGIQVAALFAAVALAVLAAHG